MSRKFINILIVFVIVAATVSLSARAVIVARSKERDAVRFAALRSIQTALELRFNEQNTYPNGENIALGDPAAAACLGAAGFADICNTSQEMYLRRVIATVPAGLPGSVACGVPARPAFCYFSRANGASYGINFEMENTWSEAGLVRGVNCAMQDGFRPGACPR